MSDEPEPINPFAAPLADDGPVSPESAEANEAEVIRRELLGRETNIKSIAILYGLSATFLTFTVIAGGIAVINAGAGPLEFGFIGLLALLTALLWYCVIGIRRLDPAIRPWAIGLSSLLILISLASLNPLGVAFNGFVLWLVGSEKGKRVLAPGYKDIIAATPHIKYKTSIVVWILLGLVLVVLGLALVSVFFVKQ